MTIKPTQPQYDEDGHFEGYEPRFCGEHRTVGSHRAWCFDCAEWCYPNGVMACEGCLPHLNGRELLDALIKTFEDMKTIREATGDPAARGVQACLDHVRELRGGMA
jgi:hypothetical protein